MMKLTIRKDAEEDINAAYLYYESKMEDLGEEFIQFVGDSLQKIEEFPMIHSKIRKNIRRALINKFPYGIYYIEKDESIVVFAVLHARKDPVNWKSRI